MEVIQKRVFSAAIANWIGQLFTLVTAFLIAPFLLHRLGESQYGILMLVGSLVAQGTNLDFGIRPALIRYVAAHLAREETSELRSLIATSLWLYCGLGVIAMALTLILAPLLPRLFNVPSSEADTIVAVGLLMGAQLAFSIPGSTPSALIAGLQRYDILNAISIIWTLLTAVMTVVVILAGGGVVAVSAVTLAISVLMPVVYALYLNKAVPHLRLTFRGARRDFASKILSFSASMLVMNASGSLQAQSGEMVLGAFFPISFVSSYSLGKRLSNVPSMIADRFLWGLSPLSSELDARGEATSLQLLCLTTTRIALAICLPFAAVIMVLAGPFLSLWVGAQYAEYAPIAVILAAAGVMDVAGRPSGTILLGLGRHRRLAVISVCAAVANIALSILLVRQYGPVGAAIGALIPTMLLAFGWLSYSLSTLEISPRRFFTQSLLPVLLPFVLEIGLLLGLKWIIEPSQFLTVGCTAAAGVGLFLMIYLYFFSGDSERQLIRTVVVSANSFLTRKVNSGKSSTNTFLP